MGKPANKAVFLDRDGTLLVEVGYLNHPSLVAPYEFTARALNIARRNGFLLIGVTNQSGIARGYLSERDLAEVHRRMQTVLGKTGASLDAVYYCAHHPHGTVAAYRRKCDCRKPGTALGLAAAERFDIDLSRSYMIGDKETDLLFGRNLGVTPCLVRTGYGSREEGTVRVPEQGTVPVFDNVLAAVDWITSGG
jgi:D-glycero-D-manno-heptose 1,7-bisphosphate phosphatase